MNRYTDNNVALLIGWRLLRIKVMLMVRWIRGYEGQYSCNQMGEVFKHYKSRPPKRMTLVFNKNKWVVRLSNELGRKEFNLARLIYETWVGEIPYGMVVAKIGGTHLDCHVNNLKLISMRERGKMTGAMAKSKPVELLDESGIVIDSWGSARKAAKDLFMSYQTVMDICNKKRKKPLANLRWEKAG